MERGKRLLLTGASGFVGSAIAPILAAEGWDVVPGRRDGLTESLPGCDAVVHLAGRAHVMREETPDPAALYRRDNAELTIDLARAASAAGVRRFIFISTAKVLGEGRDRPYTEADSPSPQDHYARSKLAAEEGLVSIARAVGMEAVVLRPPLIYGPGVRANFLALVKIVDKGIPLPLGGVRNHRSLVSVTNLGQAVAAALVRPLDGPAIFAVSDGEDVSTPQLIRQIASALGKPARLVPVPVAVLRAGAALVGRSDAIDRLAGSFTLDVSAIRNRLGWSPTHTLRAGLEDVARWYAGFR